MIKTETLENNLIRTYSDEGYQIIQDGTGIYYDEAIDPADKGRTYTESDVPVDGEDITDEELAHILTGQEGET